MLSSHVRKNALSVIDATGGKRMSKTVGFTFEVEFVTDGTSGVDACAFELENTINDKIYDMFNVIGLPYFRVETNVIDNDSEEN